MKFRECFILVKYKYDILSLCETTNVFIDAFCYFKIHFHQLGSFKLVKLMYIQRGIFIQRVITKHGLPSVYLSQMMNLKIELQGISVWVQFGLLR